MCKNLFCQSCQVVLVGGHKGFLQVFNIIVADTAATLYTTYENVLERLFVYKSDVLTTCIFTHAHQHSHLRSSSYDICYCVRVCCACLFIHVLCIPNGSLSLPRPLYTHLAEIHCLSFTHNQDIFTKSML